MKTNTFHQISIRGRVAYGICCLENALKHFNHSLADWHPLLEKYWTFTNIEFLDDWHEQLAEYTPSAILEELSYNQKEMEYIDRNNYEYLQQLYRSANPVVLDIADSIFHMGTVDLYGKLTNYSPNTLEELEGIIKRMKENNIALPELYRFTKFSYEQREGWGNIFSKEEII